MSQHAEARYGNPARSARAAAHVDQSGWVGCIAFAGGMMVVLGSFHVLESLVALFNDEYFFVGASALVVSVDITAWSVTRVLLGVVVAGAGYALFAGHLWGTHRRGSGSHGQRGGQPGVPGVAPVLVGDNDRAGRTGDLGYHCARL